MNKAVFFKWLQKKNKFRNTERIIVAPDNLSCIPDKDYNYIEKYIETLKSEGIKYTFPSDIHYPRIFYCVPEPPLFLEYRGVPAWTTNECLSIVGSRDLDHLTRTWLEKELIDLLRRQNLCLVSGGARGVDQAVHRCALRAEKPTVAILPSGLNQVYPTDLKLMEKWIIAAGGALLTEFEYDQKINKHHFFLRNRLIAQLSRVLLVAQAKIKSGTFLTVHHALQSGRIVAVVPAHPQQNLFTGNIQLLQDGAFPVYNAQDLDSLLTSEMWSSLGSDKVLSRYSID